jgi:hypothetical protein
VFSRKRTPPSKPFIHSDDCRILKADPSTKVPWNYLGDGFWKAECVCTYETYVEPAVDARVRLDPLDPATARHLGQCEFKDVDDPAILRLALKVQDGAHPSYQWVSCAGCEVGWQVPLYAESVGGPDR